MRALLLLALHSALGRRGRACMLCAPCLVTVLVCVLSPVNGRIRYLMPVMASLPLVFVYMGEVSGERAAPEDG